MKSIIEDLKERIENTRRELFKWCNEDIEDMASITAIIDKNFYEDDNN